MVTLATEEEAEATIDLITSSKENAVDTEEEVEEEAIGTTMTVALIEEEVSTETMDSMATVVEEIEKGIPISLPTPMIQISTTESTLSRKRRRIPSSTRTSIGEEAEAVVEEEEAVEATEVEQ